MVMYRFKFNECVLQRVSSLLIFDHLTAVTQYNSATTHH